jgi:alpha-L-fucosidase
VSPPSWWNRCRYGLHVHASIASVPAFAPLGAEAGWYHRHLGAGGAHAPGPLVESLAHHRDRWGFVGRYQDFLPLLTFEHFDPEHLVEVAGTGRMGLVVMSARHHDGFCWWDAPGTECTSVRHGPGRNVIDELGGACERNGMRFGVSYSPLGVAGRAVLAAQVLDLVERYHAELLWALDALAGDDGHGIVHPAREAAGRDGAGLVVTDGWGGADADVTRFRREPPTGTVGTSWALSRPLGWSAVLNRAERAEHLLSPARLVALLTETAAKGGTLLVEVGLDADGVLPRHHADTIAAVGSWLAAHPTVVEGSRPFHTWGDEGVRYTVPAAGLGERVHAVDVGGAGRFAALHSDEHRVRAVRATDGASIEWVQDRAGLHVTRLDRTPVSLAAVYEVDLEPVGPAVTLFESVPTPPTALAALLADARPGEVLRLGDGRYAGPATVPAGVSVVGAGADRTIVVGSPTAALVLSADAHLSDLAVADSRPPVTAPSDDLERLPGPDEAATVVNVAGDGASMTRVSVDGAVGVVGASGALIDGCTMSSVVARGATQLTVRASTLAGSGHPVGIDIVGGTGHRFEANEIRDHLGAIRVRASAGVSVRRNHLRARWWGVRLTGCEGATVTANLVDATMRAVDVNGGTEIEVAGNVVTGGDSGCVIWAGTTHATVVDNRWERCRIGLLVWDAPGVHIGPNRVEQHAGDAVVIGPELA